MNNKSRRQFLQLMGTSALAASFPLSISRALATPAYTRTGTIKDVQHIVILTQENQSFDRYFGTLRGVRGFADPRAVKLPNGSPVWDQPILENDPLRNLLNRDTLPPFRVNIPNLGLTFMDGTEHGWNDGHEAWNNGNYDRWVGTKGPMTMAYMQREDIPYHFALADAFTVCDAYHCSVMGPTDPNRYHMWSGWIGNDGNNGGPVRNNAEAGYDWSTYPERLTQAGISWKVYQDEGVGLDAAGFWGWTGDQPYIGNYGDNSLLYFHQYQNAPAGSPLAIAAKTGTRIVEHNSDPNRLFDLFRQDVESGKLPQVSYIASPEAYSEHSNWPSNFGAWYISQILDILTSNPEVWSKTVLLINYDENDGDFDHIVPPTPANDGSRGLSTVSVANEILPASDGFVEGPIGLGLRVPLIAVSPWSKGGYVNSQVFDHTSVIRFLEARFADEFDDMIESNITEWRRAVCGDLTTVFNFANPNQRAPKLPSTATYFPPDLLPHPSYDLASNLDKVVAGIPAQEKGIRPARALPYEMDARGSFTREGKFQIDFVNSGEASVVFHVRSALGGDPRSYTVEPGKKLSDTWTLEGSAYDIAVYGPNGFFRSFKGIRPGNGAATLNVSATYDEEQLGIRLHFRNQANAPVRLKVKERYTGKSYSKKLEIGAYSEQFWPLEKVHGWYELAVTTLEDSAFANTLAGHVENGEESVTDPLMGGLI